MSENNRKQFWLKLLMIAMDIVVVNAAYYIALYARFFGYDNLTDSYFPHQKVG
jgi:hypothetical protein